MLPQSGLRMALKSLLEKVRIIYTFYFSTIIIAGNFNC